MSLEFDYFKGSHGGRMVMTSDNYFFSKTNSRKSTVSLSSLILLMFHSHILFSFLFSKIKFLVEEWSCYQFYLIPNFIKIVIEVLIWLPVVQAAQGLHVSLSVFLFFLAELVLKKWSAVSQFASINMIGLGISPV